MERRKSLYPFGGTYFVDSTGKFTTSNPDINLEGSITQVTSGIANAIVFVANFGDAFSFGSPVVLAGVAERDIPVEGSIGPTGPTGATGATGATGPSLVVTRNSTTVTVVSSTTPTNLVNFSIAGGTLGSDKQLRGRLLYHFLNETGSAQAVTMKLIFDTTTVATAELIIPN